MTAEPLGPDQYDAEKARAESLRERALDRHDHDIAPHVHELERAKDRYWAAVSPLESALDAAYGLAAEIDRLAFEGLQEWQRQHDADHAAFVRTLLDAAAEGGEEGLRTALARSGKLTA